MMQRSKEREETWKQGQKDRRTEGKKDRRTKGMKETIISEIWHHSDIRIL
jgi:hypothetical protein